MRLRQLPTAAHTALALASATGGGQVRGLKEKPSLYNNFTNYAVSICKLAEIIPLHLLFLLVVIYLYEITF